MKQSKLKSLFLNKEQKKKLFIFLYIYINLQFTKNMKIGIMADSHGNYKSIASALKIFNNKDCYSIYHLGDICDSSIPETVDKCLNILKKQNIYAVKGNNDHIIAINHANRNDTCISQTSLDFLLNLPQSIEHKKEIFTHSLPFEKELGASSMSRGMGENEINHIFIRYSNHIIFRGHSHTPEIICKNSKSFFLKTVVPDTTINLSDIQPCIITCGATINGCCMIFDRDKTEITFLAC